MAAIPYHRGQRIRFGIMCNGPRLPAWQAEAVKALLAGDNMEVAVLIIPGRRTTAATRWRRFADLPRLLWNLFNKGYIERKSGASRPVDLSELFAGVPVRVCVTEPVGRFAERFNQADVEAIRDLKLDFILRFGFGIIKGEVLDAPRWGVWSFHHGDEQAYRGRPPGFWELVNREPVIGAILQRLTERLDAGVILYRGYFKPIPHSYLRTRDELFLGSAEWPASVVGAIQGGSIQAGKKPSTTSAMVRRDPGNLVMLKFLASQIIAFLKAQWRGLTGAAKWTVGIADAPITAFLEKPVPAIRWLPEQGAARYLADPFALSGHQRWGLVEDYDYRTHRGLISAIDLTTGFAHPVLDPGVHASYPYLFEADDEIWCVPETYQAREVRLYRAVAYPDHWEHHTTLVEGFGALDPTVFRHLRLWWLFCTDHQSGPNTKLRIWSAPQLTGPWSAHPLNPVKTDVRSSRPAGTPFTHEGALYRPAQDGSDSYGGSISINRVDILTTNNFLETVVAAIEPPPNGRYRAGLHTIGAFGDRTIVDGRRDTFIQAAFRREINSRLRRIRRW